MAASYTLIIVVMMVATGTLNTISAGYQQRAEGKGRDWATSYFGWVEGNVKTFDHPYLQAMGMMAGECLCMLAFIIMTGVFKKGLQTEEQKEANRDFSATILLPAALFDLFGTSMNYVGMILSYPSSFQMLRGSVIVFTAFFTIIFLKKWPKMYQWFGMVIIIGGLCIVGAGDMIFQEDAETSLAKCQLYNATTSAVASTTTGAIVTTTGAIASTTTGAVVTTTGAIVSTTTGAIVSTTTGAIASTTGELLAAASTVTTAAPTTTTAAYICEDKEPKLGSNPLVGDIIIIAGEIFHALQFIWEEYYLSRFDLPPLKVVGYEGIFGFCTIGILLWPMYFIKVGETFGLGPEFRFEDAIDGLTQVGSSGAILGWTIGNMCSIAMFNFAGVSVTKQLNGTTRAVLDNIRQIFIWAFSLIVGWQKFNFMTPIGFVVLIVGIWIYNDVILRPGLYKYILKKPLPELPGIEEEV